MSLPTDDKARKALPIWDGVIMYFPDVWAEIAKVSKAGNDQHNPGEPLHWARGKSMDQMNTAMRHMIDHGTGTLVDTDGGYHLAKAIWRLCAELQLTLERGGAEEPTAYDEDCPLQGAELPKPYPYPAHGFGRLNAGLGRASPNTRQGVELSKPYPYPTQETSDRLEEADQRSERGLGARNWYRHF